jgi:3-hydroxybutyryl-CoA dehydrogenase
MRVVVVGAGTMGSRVAIRCAQFGCDVTVVARNRGRAKSAIVAAAEEVESAKALERVTFEEDLSVAAGAQLVYEAIPEVLAEKQQLFGELEEFVDDHVPLVSGTSTFMPARMGFYLEFPKRVFVAHFIHPVTLVPLAEIVTPSENVDSLAKATLETWIETLELEPILLPKPLTGFIVNRLQFALVREALNIVEQGGATAEDVDLIMRLGLGPRWTATGPIESVALGGASTFAHVARSIVPTLDNRKSIPGLERPNSGLPVMNAERRASAVESRKKAYASARELK